VQLLEYIAWMQGEMVKLDSICEYVFGFDKTGEKAESSKLREAFASHRKHLLKDLRDAAAKLNRKIGQELIPLDIDIFDHKPGHWWLSSNCHVCVILKQ
jgi:hypothetical protein